MSPIFTFDRSFTGFLTAVYTGISDSLENIHFCEPGDPDSLQLFYQNTTVKTDTTKARQIWQDLGLKGTEIQKRVYYSFLHKNKGLRTSIYRYVATQLNPEGIRNKTLNDPQGADLMGPTRAVALEKVEMEHRLPFRNTAEGLWYCEIRPEHFVLPLLSRYCRCRYPSDPWMILDTRREQSLSSISGSLVLTDHKSVVKSKLPEGNQRNQISGNKPAVVRNISEKEQLNLTAERPYNSAFRKKEGPEKWERQAV